ncbi:hypothetical protein Pelo_16781 [Pelomyxa schiedti]|nr:hypothetical protein Pelo_16781 [Pelomyxa schiedti]
MSRQAFTWIHANCNGTMSIGRNAHLMCSSGHSHHMKDWLFKCENHDYLPGSLQGFLDAISMVGQAAGASSTSLSYESLAIKQWVTDCVVALNS